MPTKKVNANLIAVVDILNDLKFHDGNSIGEKLGISRNAVFKFIKRLKSYDVQVEAIKSKGYKLLKPLILLNPEVVLPKLISPTITVDIVESVDSTNNYLKPYFTSLEPRVCIAERQTRGRGRFNRLWHSPFAENLYLSFQYRFNKELSELSGLSLVASLAALKTVKAFCHPESLGVKWPNDITYRGIKFVGCLVELQAEANGTACAIIGVGMNANMQHDKKNTDIGTSWTSIREISGQYVDRNQLAAELINNLYSYISKFETSGLSIFLKEWEAADCLSGKTVTVENQGEETTGLAQGINLQGQLLIKLDNGVVHPFSSGHTSIVKKDKVTP